MFGAASLASHLPRAVVDIAIMAMFNHSQSVQSQTGLDAINQEPWRIVAP